MAGIINAKRPRVAHPGVVAISTPLPTPKEQKQMNHSRPGRKIGPLGYCADELLAQLDAEAGVDQVRSAISAYDAGDLTLGQLIGEIAEGALRADMARLTAAWEFFDEYKPGVER